MANNVAADIVCMFYLPPEPMRPSLGSVCAFLDTYNQMPWPGLLILVDPHRDMSKKLTYFHPLSLQWPLPAVIETHAHKRFLHSYF